MTQIGVFTRTAAGIAGKLHTLTLQVPLILIPIENSDAPRAPAYRIHLGESADGPEIGAAWRHTGDKAGAYLSLVLDDPVLPRPLRANLFSLDPEGARYRLIWNRPTRAGTPS